MVNVKPASQGRVAPAMRAPAGTPPTAQTMRAMQAPVAPTVQPGWLNAQVVGRAQAARDAITLWLAIPRTQRAPAPYQPGQFITLALPGAQGPIYRSYSLCGDGRQDAPWEITIKRQEGGRASNYLYSNAQPGMLLQASAPVGTFTLPPQLTPGMTLIFVATGSGITPIMGMLRALARVAPSLRLRVRLHYAYRTPDDAIYGPQLAALDPQRQWLQQWHYLSAHNNRMTGERVIAASGADAQRAHWYVCGSDHLKRALEAQLLRAGAPQAQFHSESFGEMRRQSVAAISNLSQRGMATPAAAGRTTARIKLADSGVTLAAQPGETLLETLERSGYRPPFSCRAGVCATCQLHVVAGQVKRGNDSGLSASQRASGVILSCVAQPMGDITLASAGGPRVARPAGAHAANKNVSVRRPNRTALRWALVVGALALFAGTWSLTNHKPGVASASSSTSSSSGNSGSSTTTSGDDGGASATATPSGSSGVSTSPSFPSNSGTGVS